MNDSPLSGISILVIEDDKLLCRRVAAYLESRGGEVMSGNSVEEARNLLGDFSFDVVLSDIHLPDGDGLDLLRGKAYPATTRVIVMTAEGGVETAVEAMRLGAADFLTKPFELDELPLVILRSRRQQKQARIDTFRKEAQSQDSGLFFGEAMAGIRLALDKIIETDQRLGDSLPPVLLIGQTGTGKTSLARWLHEQGPRSANELVERFELDAAAVSFYAIDSLSHRFWADSFPDEFDEETTSKLDPAFEKTLQRAYAGLDRAVGEILDALPEESAVILVSDHGFEAHDSPQRRWSFFLADRLTKAVPPDGDYEVSGEFGFPIVRVFKGPFERRDAALARVEAFYDSITTPSGDPLFWTQPVDIAERPPGSERGFVERGKQLALSLLGRLLGTELGEDAHGFMVAVPLGGWEDIWPDGEVRIGDETVPVREVVYGDGFSGQHLATAVFMAAGPGIVARPERGELSVLDIAPLYSWLAGAAVPGDLAGRLPTEFLDAALLAERPPERVSAGRWPRLPVAEPDIEDADLLERLKAMGYAN